MSTIKRNKEEEQSFRYTNALVHSSSPYLLQHAHNPVNWYPWGEEALQKARKENKPLIISIGYSACHWCHVMERESYADPAVAEYMNEHFIAIKVDREERPDVDQIYMNASMLLTGSGGWPLNAFALPDGKPFYALTYLPRKQWLDLLHEIVKVCTTQAADVKEQAEALTRGIRGAEVIKTPKENTAESLTTAYQGLFERMRSSIDLVRGGFGRAPKFPMPNAWEMLLQYYYFTGDEHALESVTVTLDQMARGGIYDVLGGGFARYATDMHWRVPHFEKMLYDNAQLVSLYAHGYQVLHKPLYAAVIKQTLDFIQREMSAEEGGFYASINADSEGEEGKFYVWYEEEINRLLEAKATALVKDYYGITAAGNWEQGKNILYRNTEDEVFAREQGITIGNLDKIIKEADSVLFQARAERERPTTDRKILTSWNALMIKGYTDAYRALGEQQYLDTALKAANFLERNMMNKDGSIRRNYMNGVPSIPGLLDDYAFLAEAFIALYQVTFDKNWLSKAKVLTTYTLAHFYDKKQQLFFYTPDTSENLIARKKEMEDNVLPASNSVMAHVLYRLGIFYDNSSYIDLAYAMLHRVIDQIPAAVPYFSNWAQLLGLFQKGSCEVAIMGKEALNKAREMQVHYLQTVLFMGGEEENLPLLEGKNVPEKTMIYVCENKVCRLPVTEVRDAMDQIR